VPVGKFEADDTPIASISSLEAIGVSFPEWHKNVGCFVDAPKGTRPGFLLDAEAWRAAGRPAKKGDGFDRDAVWEAVPEFVRAGVLCIPDPPTGAASYKDKKGRRSAYFPGTKAQVQGISGAHRHLCRALPGTTLINFDYSSCHSRIAAALVNRAGMPDADAFLAICGGTDPYQAFADRYLQGDRATAKVVFLALLNGATDKMVQQLTGWGAAQASALSAAWGKDAKPWFNLCAFLHAQDPLPHTENAKQRGSRELQRCERALLDALYKRLKTTNLEMVVSMYDGALYSVQSRDVKVVQAAQFQLQQAAEAVAVQHGYPQLKAKVSSGLNWREAEGK
jgi:hypothetical protein